MNLSRKWLNEFVDLPLSEVPDRAFAEAMTVSGSKVEVTEDLSETCRNVVVGRVAAMEKHPDSDHMWVCSVDVGREEPLQIVTGAQNVSVGDLVPTALDGALLPNGMEIRTTELRGVRSEGMLCSLKELGLTVHDYPDAIENGIFIITEHCAPGDDVAALIGRDNHVVEFEITPNRPDCLCMIGLAREAAVTFDRPLKLHTPAVEAKAGGDIRELTKIVIDEPSLCRRYTARMVRNVKIAPSPAWMRERIRNAGMRPINNLVDITNYVMLEYGQPMHAFDFSCVTGGEIHVRCARPGETIRTLDGTERALSESMLCICDTEKPVGVAGVMGGENSEIVGDTAMVLFESANFDGVSIRRTATALGMRTDASSRYEKGLDPENTFRAVQRACELVEMLGAGEVVEGIIDVYPAGRKETVLNLEPGKINALLGTDIDADTMRVILRKLGFAVEGEQVTVPSWRADVEHWSDLAEEVARFYGYNEIPTRFTGGISTCGGLSPEQAAEKRVGEVCRSLGMDEIITYSFISPSWYDRIRLPADSPLRNSLRILNPLGEDTSIMRTTVLPSMLEILTRNYNYRNKEAYLYEIGRTYLPRPDGLADEPKTVSLGAYGEKMDFFVLKGWGEALLAALGIENARFTADDKNPSYHPTRCAKIFAVPSDNARRERSPDRSADTLAVPPAGAHEVPIGTLGQIHPLVMRNYGIDAPFYCAQLSLDALLALRGSTPVFRPLPRFPAVTRDIAVLCDAAVPAGDMQDCIRAAGGETLKDVRVFDVYTGTGIAPGKKSIAFSLTMRSDDQTLTDEHAEATVRRILAALEQNFSAQIR